MAFSEFELKKIEKALLPLCKERTTPHCKSGGTVSFQIKNHEVLLLTSHPYFKDPTEIIELGIAKFKYVRTTNTWHLYWLRASLKWQSYEPLPIAKFIEPLAQEVWNDPYACFFG